MRSSLSTNNLDGHFGYLAKPTLFDASYTDPGRLLVDNISGTMSISGTFPYPYQGDEVHHVGRTSGWQSGSVTALCSDLQRVDDETGLPYILWCQSFVTAVSGRGDSGGPAFFYRSDLNAATIVGKLFAGGALLPGQNTFFDGFWMSAVENIQADNGSFAVH